MLSAQCCTDEPEVVEGWRCESKVISSEIKIKTILVFTPDYLIRKRKYVFQVYFKYIHVFFKTIHLLARESGAHFRKISALSDYFLGVLANDRYTPALDDDYLRNVRSCIG